MPNQKSPVPSFLSEFGLKIYSFLKVNVMEDREQSNLDIVNRLRDMHGLKAIVKPIKR